MQRLWELAGLSGKIAGAVALGRRFPLIVSWNITYICPLACEYCGVCRTEVKDLPTARVLSMVESLARAGARFVGFSGGEPLVRRDLGEIVDACRDNGMDVMVHSAGQLFARRVDSLMRVNEMQFSLDGPREIHDEIRGKGVYDKVMEAVDICKERDISVSLAAVISKRNLNSLPELLEAGREGGVGIYFQPGASNYTPGHTTVGDYFPDVAEYRAFMDQLIAEKSKRDNPVSNSVSGLRYLREWPNLKHLHCAASRMMCAIEPDGSLAVCDMFPRFEEHVTPPPPPEDFEAALAKLELPYRCPRCLAGSMTEFNLSFNGKFDAASGMIKRFIKNG